VAHERPPLVRPTSSSVVRSARLTNTHFHSLVYPAFLGPRCRWSKKPPRGFSIWPFPGASGDGNIITGNQVDHENGVAQGEYDDESMVLDPEATIRKTLGLAAKLEHLSIEFGSKSGNDLGLKLLIS